MADIRKGIELVQGREPTPEQIAKIQQVAHSFDIPQNDPLFPFVVFMDVSTGVFTELPGRIVKATNKAANNAAETAAARATEQVSKAVADLIPTITKTVSRETSQAIGNETFTRSCFGMAVSMVLLFVAFAVGWMSGGNFIEAVRQGKLTSHDMLGLAAPSIGAGAVMMMFAVFGVWLIVTDDEHSSHNKFWWGLGFCAVAVLIAAVFLFML